MWGGVLEAVVAGEGRAGSLAGGSAFVIGVGGTGLVTVRCTFRICGALAGMPFGPPIEPKKDIAGCV